MGDAARRYASHRQFPSLKVPRDSMSSLPVYQVQTYSYVGGKFEMNYIPKTHAEGGKFFGRVLLKDGFEYYIGPFNSRSTARRRVLDLIKCIVRNSAFIS